MEIPHFCYHPALGSLGACRLCMVELQPSAARANGRATMASCLLDGEGGYARIADGGKSRGGAPVGDRGGDDQSSPRLPGVRRGRRLPSAEHDRGGGPSLPSLRGTKRTFLNQYLGPLVWHSMDRCITCYRCVRFYQDYALGDDLGAFGSRNRVYFGRSDERSAGEPLRRQPRRGLPDRGVHGSSVYRRNLHPRVGSADRAVGMPALQRRLQHHARGTRRQPAAGDQPREQTRQRVVHLRPRALRPPLHRESTTARARRAWTAAR